MAWDALKRLEAHIRSREIELKEKQDVELTQIGILNTLNFLLMTWFRKAR